ncbi:MAG: hypothetical protein QW478_05040 [Candidatus Micrarchaeaceae archaeon]
MTKLVYQLSRNEDDGGYFLSAEWAQANMGKLKAPELVLGEFRDIDI